MITQRLSRAESPPSEHREDVCRMPKLSDDAHARPTGPCCLPDRPSSDQHRLESESESCSSRRWDNLEGPTNRAEFVRLAGAHVCFMAAVRDSSESLQRVSQSASFSYSRTPVSCLVLYTYDHSISLATNKLSEDSEIHQKRANCKTLQSA
ncbi:hypothetical protein Micbo1qcDRAFT_44142 [Microdochium bolleyi]|uniref:Uncharacterized protein n=1 Tax=Microdochium bolleyi TaxID=196109 RepID=A0A136JB85_9PEZI|nr:hypothetical protein Micbo1qcDRAFT_44142 [Microdochium bolleyi]